MLIINGINNYVKRLGYYLYLGLFNFLLIKGSKMSLKDLNIKISYRSKGNNVADEFLNPAFKCSKIYKRSAGFFSSSVYDLISDGIKGLVENGGKIFLICSPELSSEDIEAIKLGTKLKKETVECNFIEDFEYSLREIKEENVRFLVGLIKNNILNIVIADMDGNGIFHDKMGIIEDGDGNKVLFVGSSNESKYGLSINYEKIRVSKSWIQGDSERINDDEKDFDEIWEGKNTYIKKIDIKEAIIRSILKISKERNIELDEDLDLENEKSNKGIKLRDYQKEAIEKWKDNGNKGFFVMATGTGKTWTAIYCSLEISKEEDIFLVICAPYKHLIKQWCNDIEKVYKDNNIVMISSENPRWELELKDSLLYSKFNGGTVIAVSTIKSFNSDRFLTILKKNKMKKMLIVDEAHRFKNLDNTIKEQFNYMLGLSATPAARAGDEFAKELLEYFGGEVYSLPIEFAIKKKYLVKYDYYPLFVNASEEEEKEFNKYTRLMMSCFKGNNLVDPERYAQLKRARLRVISMAEAKNDSIDQFLKVVDTEDHMIVYCGDGRMLDVDRTNQLRHIDFMVDRLSHYGMKVDKFTAEENMKQRMQEIDQFNRGMIDALVAIRCLDEGVDIPSIKNALILSSNDDYREFVQRRGRILRKYENPYSGEIKEKACIYDVVVCPSYDNKAFALIELRRMNEYLKLADNKDDYIDKFNSLCSRYDISIDELQIIDSEEDDTDE